MPPLAPVRIKRHIITDLLNLRGGVKAMVEKSLAGETCVICSREAREGLAILSSIICRSCEAVLLRTQVGSLDYMSVMDGLKKIWMENEAVHSSQE